MNRLAPCRHRSAPVSLGVYPCTSPRLLGLKLVTEDVCRACPYRDHEPSAGAGPTVRLLPCLWLSPRTPGAVDAEDVVHECLHPAHRSTTLAQCRACPDYLFPVLTSLTPVDVVRQILDGPPRPQPDGWWGWPNVQEALRRAASEAIAQTPPYPGHYRGRGVIIAGGGKYFAAAYVTVRVLRHVGCQLPIELWHLSGEVTETMHESLRPYGVTCVDADVVAREQPFRFLHGHWWKGWQLKPYAIASCRFEEVLFLDADCYPTRDPEFLFHWPQYRERGAIFWPDLTTSAQLLTPDLWEVFGTEPGWLPLESGQIVIDKRTCWRELRLALWYNAHADLVYNLLWGDKDTFNIAWRRLGATYSMPRPWCDWDTHTLLQYGPDGTVLFQHRCQDKFRLAEESFGGTFQRFTGNQYNPRLAHEDVCFRYLEELRRGKDH